MKISKYRWIAANLWKIAFGVCLGLSISSAAAAALVSQQSTNAPLASVSAFSAPVLEFKTSTQQPDPQEITVYVTRTGSKYHRASCQYLRQSKIPISLKDAKQSYDACSVCHPPQ